MGIRSRLPTTIFAVIAVATIDAVAALLLLSDLPTPAFVVDTQALRRHVGPPITAFEPDADTSTIYAPSIRCPKHGLVLRPEMIQREKTHKIKDSLPTMMVDCEFEVSEGQPAIGYIHSSVIRAREDAIPGEDEPLSTFLSQIDLEPALCCGDAQLVLGLNNHHVGGYYWARSAGAGSSMEAPGVCFCSGGGETSDNASTNNKRGVLRWLDEKGPTACNSNDGKRSEWVNFLRIGDTVQLVPADGQGSLLQFSRQFGRQSNEADDSRKSIRVFGISSQGRPMGSEPEVVCEWRFDCD